MSAYKKIRNIVRNKTRQTDRYNRNEIAKACKHNPKHFWKYVKAKTTRGQSNLTKSASRGAHSPVRGHPRGSKVVPLNSWGRVSY